MTAQTGTAPTREQITALVKPLTWESSYGVWRSKTPFGDYNVTGRILTLPLPMNPQQVHAGENSAKLAAQADHTARILSALNLPDEEPKP